MTLLDYSQIDEQHDEDAYGQDNISNAEDVVPDAQAHLEAPEDREDHPEGEEHEHTEEYYESPHDEAGGIIAHTGEIDLSTLPPFVDSPEVEEGEQQQEEETAEPTHAGSDPSDGITVGGDHTQDAEGQETGRLPPREDSDAAQADAPKSRQRSPAIAEVIPDSHEYLKEEEVDGVSEPKEGEEQLEVNHDVVETNESGGTLDFRDSLHSKMH